MKRWAKRIGVGFGVLLVVLIVTAALLLMFVDVDKYRPQIVSTIEQHVNAKAELGKLNLSLWGRIRVVAAGFSLSDVSHNKLVSVDEVFFDIPWGSLLKGSPVVELKMVRPQISIVKNKKGELNLLTIVKTVPDGAEPPAAAEVAQPAALPGFVLRSKLNIVLSGANLKYSDRASDLATEFKNVDLRVIDLSASEPVEVELSANVDTVLGKTLTLRGPVRAAVHITPEFTGSAFKSADLKWSIELGKLDVRFADSFHKSNAIVASGSGAVHLTNQQLELSDTVVKFNNLELTAGGTMSAAGAQTPATAAKLDIKAKIKPFALAAWSELIPALNNFTIDKTAAASADVHVTTDKIERFTAELKGPATDLKLSGRLAGFASPKIDLNIRSSGIDLDMWLKPVPAAKSSSPGVAATKAIAPADYDALTEPMRVNPIFKKLQASASANIASLRARNIEVKDIRASAKLRNLELSVDAFKMVLFGGSVSSDAKLNLAPKRPAYRFAARVGGLDLSSAVSSQAQMFKNTLAGKLAAQLTASGASFNPGVAKKSLTAQGNFVVTDMVFSTLDVGKIATEAVARAVEQGSKTIAELRQVKLQPPADYQTKYAKVGSSFTIKDGVFKAPDFIATAVPRQGWDLRGSTQVGISDYALSANWLAIDTHNLSRARDVSLETNGIRVEHILAKGSEPVQIPLHVGGTVFAPKPSYGSAPEALVKVALANVAKAAEGKLKQEAEKKAGAAIEKLGRDLGKKLFGR